MKKRVSTRVFVLLATILLSCGLLGLAACKGGSSNGRQTVEDSAVSIQTDGQESQDSADDSAAEGSAQPNSKKAPKASNTQVDSSKTVELGGQDSAQSQTKQSIDENGTYTSKEDVALYLHTYGHLPSNYITKDEAEDAGWKTEGLSLDEACPGKSIGGDRFGNREGKLPKAKGRTWYECDIGYKGGRSRGAKRILYSSDGLIYYTDDHYETFEKLY